MLTTTLSGKGQVVIPAEIRNKAGLQAGQRFAASLEGNKIVFTLLPRDPLLALRGTFGGKDSLTEDLMAARREERKHG